MDKLIFQQQEKGCGYACIKMMLYHFSKNKMFEDIIEPLARTSPNILSLISFAKKYGLDLKAFEAENKNDLKTNKTYPLLIIVEKDKVDHMVYLKGRKKRYFVVFDPAEGEKKVKINDLIKSFSGIYLKGTYINQITPEIKKNNVILPKDEFLLYCLEMSSLLSLFAGFYFIDESLNFLSPLIFFTIFILLKLFERVFIIKQMKKMDKYCGPIIDKSSKDEKEKLFRFYNVFKADFFSGPISLFSIFTEILFLLILLCLNDKNFSLVLIFVLIFDFCLEVIHLSKRKKEDLSLANKENIYLGKIGGNLKVETCISLFNESYKIGSRFTYIELIEIFVNLTASLLVCLLSQTITLNYLLFSFAGYYFIISKFNELIQKLLNLKELKKKVAYFIGHFKRDL